MTKRNENETGNAISDMELKVHCSNIGISVQCSSTSSINESEKILGDDDKIPQSFQKIVFLTNLRLLLSLYTLISLKISEFNQCLSVRHYFLIFYFFSAKDVWHCKVYTSFSPGHFGSRAFVGKPSNMGDHPTKIY